MNLIHVIVFLIFSPETIIFDYGQVFWPYYVRICANRWGFYYTHSISLMNDQTLHPLNVDGKHGIFDYIPPNVFNGVHVSSFSWPREQFYFSFMVCKQLPYFDSLMDWGSVLDEFDSPSRES